jgi:hypothetical protein
MEGNTTDNDVRALQAELKKAEAALKRSKTKDYYKILGIPKDCGETDIKKAYRRESLKHHPDKVHFFIYLHSFFFLSDDIIRVVMKRNLNWSPKHMLFFPIHNEGNVMILEKTKMVG